MSNSKQIRINAKAEIRSENDSDLFMGYASIFNEVTDLGPFCESIATGAFTEALKRKDDTRVLFNHNPDLVLARSTNETLLMEEDEIGLRCLIKIPETTLGNDLRILIKEGTISQMSFGFYIEKEERMGVIEGKPWYKIQSVRLFDVAPVTYPAYEGTSIHVARSIEARVEDLTKREEEIEGQKRKKLDDAFQYRERKIRLSENRGYISKF